jgi:hypothetical protein
VARQSVSFSYHGHKVAELVSVIPSQKQKQDVPRGLPRANGVAEASSQTHIRWPVGTRCSVPEYLLELSESCDVLLNLGAILGAPLKILSRSWERLPFVAWPLLPLVILHQQATASRKGNHQDMVLESQLW